MSGLALMLVSLTRFSTPAKGPAGSAWITAKRYAISALGPVSVSAAHFVAAILFLHALPRASFGLFSFLLVVSAFSLSLSGAVFTPPVALLSAHPGGMTEDERLMILKANVAFFLASTVILAGLMLVSGADVPLALALGLYGGLMSLRWVARCWSYADSRITRVLASDLAYSGFLCATLLGLHAIRGLDLWSAAIALLISAVAGVAVLIAGGFAEYGQALRRGRLSPFLQIWRTMSGWAVLGVVFSELTVNAHAYLVTFISGPHAFALLAVGSLLMRPVSLVLTALPDMERPMMSAAVRAGERARAFRIVKEFRTAAGAIWLLTAAVAAALLLWFPALVVKHEYALHDVVVVVGLSAAIAALRAFRTPESVLLQAAGEFRPLAAVGALASITSIVAALLLLMFAGPIAALAGILLGEAVATNRLFSLFRNWKRAHA